jgi:hypothetical protein
MRSSLFLAVTAAAALSIPVVVGPANADSVEVHPGPPGVTVEEHRPPPAMEEHRRPGAVIEERTEGRRDRDCVTHSESTSRNGTTVTEKDRRCD